MLTYRGFSTINRHKKFRVTNIELVKQDLINHFQIRKGEKLMDPNFGSIIWSTLFEPLDEETKRIILADVNAIVGYDPRLSVTDVVLTEVTVGLQIEIRLVYIPENADATLVLTFDGTKGRIT